MQRNVMQVSLVATKYPVKHTMQLRLVTAAAVAAAAYVLFA